mmetsp:Transcript_53255/g.165086  ORF Transcript_53255/g.165086 Transcript_53255/m.165086 type:complete len:301 (-) Transcript_53255:78-980(-)
MGPWSAPARVLLLLAAGLRPGSCLRTQGALGAQDAGRGPDRYVFVAGLPGTGLEFWQQVLRGCVEGGVCQAREARFYTSLLLQQDNEEELLEAWTGRRPGTGRLVPANLVSPDLDRLPDSVFTHAFNTGVTQHGSLDPRLDLYAKVAQRANDSFKVLVLTRKDETDLLANTMRRLKARAGEAEDKAVTAVRKLAAQVNELPSGSFRCQRYEDTQALSQHLAPLIQKDEQDAQAFAENARVAVGKKSRGCLKSEHDCPRAPKLRAALNELEGLCPAPDLDHWTSQANRDSMLSSQVEWLLD